MIVVRTPFRIGFFGEGTDDPGFYAEHGGSTLVSTINRYSYLSAHISNSSSPYLFRARYARTERVRTPHEFDHPLIRECLRYLRIRDGLDIAHASDLPGYPGLGASSSFTVGLLHALHAFRNDVVNAEELAREAIIVEGERAGDAGGHQDPYAAAYGGFMRLNFSGPQIVDVRKPDVSAERLRQLEQALLIFYVGTERSDETGLREQRECTSRNTDDIEAMMGLVDEAQRLLESDEALRGWGELLHESWIRQKNPSPGIAHCRIDDAYDAARKAGAIGGKRLGAGGRGFLLVYVEPERQDTVRAALAPLLEVPFTFSHEGSRIIFNATDGIHPDPTHTH